MVTVGPPGSGHWAGDTPRHLLLWLMWALELAGLKEHTCGSSESEPISRILEVQEPKDWLREKGNQNSFSPPRSHQVSQSLSQCCPAWVWVCSPAAVSICCGQLPTLAPVSWASGPVLCCLIFSLPFLLWTPVVLSILFPYQERR